MSARVGRYGPRSPFLARSPFFAAALPVRDVIAAGSAPIPFGSLANVRLTAIGDSRIARPRLMANILGASATITQNAAEPTFGVGGYTIREANGLEGASDLVGSVLESSAGVCLLLLGVNSTAGFSLVELQAQISACMARLDSVPVAISGASGGFVRDVAGARADVGDAVTDGAGGSAVVVHVNAGATVAWLRGASGLASGDTITGAGSGWSATLAGNVPLHSGRAFVTVSEYPADSRGPVHKAYADWLDGEPFVDNLAYFRTIKVMDALADPALSTAGNPLKWRTSLVDPDGTNLHANEAGGLVSAVTAGAALDAVLAEYPSQYPAYAVPAGVSAVDISGANVPPTGAAAPSGWTTFDVTSEPGGFVDLEGADGDPDRVISFGVANAAFAGSSNFFLRSFLQDPWTVPSGGRRYRYGLQFKITNRAGDGPPVGFASFRPQMYFPDNSFIQPTYSGGDISDWLPTITQDIALAAGVSGRFNFQPRIYVTTGGAVDVAVRMRRIGLWQLP
jgi:hypothetical protein